MRRILTAKFLGTAIAVLVGVALYVGSLPANHAIVIAGPSVCSYYSNATYKKVVGARGTGCCGEPISWGVVTAYAKCQKLYCLDVLCPN